MRKIAFIFPLLAVFIFGSGHWTWAQDEPQYYDEGYGQGDQYPPDQSPSDEYLLSPQELDDLLGPIALYPDPLIAQILPAATFVDQVEEAARYVRQNGSAARVDNMPWDVSVKAVAHYPDVLYMMEQKFEWTASLGQAYIEQPQDVMDAIQRLRAAADSEGNLTSSPQQQVVTEGDNIAIVPASPEYIYVPAYDPQVVYYEPYYPGYTFITFSSPFIIGAWLNRDCDWHRHRVYYHGWRGHRGWVGRSRPHIHDRRGVYINRRAEVVRTSDRVLRHDTRRYREQLRQTTTRRLETRGMPGPTPTATRPHSGRTGQQRGTGAGQPRTGAGRQGAPSVRGSAPAPATGGKAPATTPRTPATGGKAPVTTTQPSATGGKTPATATQTPASRPHQRLPGTTAPAPTATTPATTPPATTTPAPGKPQARQRPSTTGQRQPERASRPESAPSTRDVYRGWDVQKTQPASQSGYGGYGSGRDATIYRERGQSSRERIPHTSPRAPGLPNSYRPAAVPRPVSPAPASPAPRPVSPAPAPVTAPRSVSPAPAPVTAPRSVAPAPVAVPRSAAPAPAPRPVVAPAAPVSRPSAPAGGMGAPPSGGRGAAPGGRR